MKIPKRIAQTLMGSLKGGVVPRVGLPYITVGRASGFQGRRGSPERLFELAL